MKEAFDKTFALHATSRGFSYVLFDGPLALKDWGTVHAKGDKNAVCLRHFDQLLADHAPQTLLLEAFGKGTSLRSERIARLYKSMINLAEAVAIGVVVYRLADVKAAFKAVGATTRQEIAEAVGKHIDAFGHQVPKPRKPWESEDRRMALFSATALVLTHYHFGNARLFDDLSA